VDVVPVGRWVIFPQTDGRLLVVLGNVLVFFSSSLAVNGTLSVHDNVLHQRTVNLPLCILGNTRPGQKYPGLSFEAAVRRHHVAQGRSLNHLIYSWVIRRLHVAIRRNDKENTVGCETNH
jgi:hypothetical protein